MSLPILPQIGRYVIPTNQIEEFVNIVSLWIRQSLPGGLIYGRQRAGKSTAIARFSLMVPGIFHDTVGCVITQVEPDTGSSPKQFWGGLLKGMSVMVPPNKTAEVRRDWFVGRIIEAAASTPLKKVVVLLDEASLLTELAWMLLLGVDNELRQTHDIDVTWIFVGQPELADTIALLLGIGRREVVGRFMADTYRFREMTDIEDFGRALAGFDTLRDPDDGLTLSQRAHPKKFANGWRFRDESKILYEALQHAREEQKLIRRDGMSMQAFVRLTSHLIAETIPELGVDEPLTLSLVLDAILATECMVFERHAELLEGMPAARKGGR